MKVLEKREWYGGIIRISQKNSIDRLMIERGNKDLWYWIAEIQIVDGLMYLETDVTLTAEGMDFETLNKLFRKKFGFELNLKIEEWLSNRCVMSKLVS